jgi:tetratricopeptide (TPR) repeat protein
MSAETLEIIKEQYQAGKAAFERGQYRQSVECLQKASALVDRNTHFGGEVQIWLVTAYEAANQRTEAIALCQQLDRHPDIEIRKQSRQLLYILEAPQLNRRPEWLTEIPDLGAIADNENNTRLGSATTSAKSSSGSLSDPAPVDLSQVNTKDNRFIWVALMAILLILGGLIWWGF